MQKSTARWILLGLLGHEAFHAAWRWKIRKDLFAKAERRAKELGRPLVVIGAPTTGLVTRVGPQAYGCGDVCVDLVGCAGCPRSIVADITQPVPLDDDSAVVFCSCVLEYVSNPELAKREILRIAGDLANVYVAGVGTRTLTAYLYPGAMNVVRTTDHRDFTVEPLPWVGKVAVNVGLSYLAVKAW